MGMVAIMDLGLRYHSWVDVDKYLIVFTWLKTHWLNLGEKFLFHFHFENRSIQGRRQGETLKANTAIVSGPLPKGVPDKELQSGTN